MIPNHNWLDRGERVEDIGYRLIDAASSNEAF
jgi:hypothetical protein